MEFDGIITVENLIFFAGCAIFACWVRKTSLGRKSLADSVPRRNNMPLYLPFIPLFIWFGIVTLITSIAKVLLSNLQDWQNDFLDNLILGISELSAIAVIIFLAKIHFTRRLKGFGLNIKTIVKDFFAAIVNLLAVWPLIVSAMVITIYVGGLVWGREYEMQQHQQLKLITEHSQLLSRILIVVVAVIIVPLLEEMLFRGLFQTTIRSYFEAFRSLFASPNKAEEERTTDSNGAWPAIVISSGLFTMTHANAGHWPALFVLGVCMGYAYEKSGSLFRPIFIHSFFNAISIIATLNQ
ncbi:MAG: CPBP family intramembrane metalloprotease [Planctomycetes bacterium]|nr:CPBP family intramembrane metalloprotease [Planctomycetota bacterium]MBL7144597.1 CPBP family intramembrane metalloprotease [Phycisphaerae bacterium]